MAADDSDADDPSEVIMSIRQELNSRIDRAHDRIDRRGADIRKLQDFVDQIKEEHGTYAKLVQDVACVEDRVDTRKREISSLRDYVEEKHKSIRDAIGDLETKLSKRIDFRKEENQKLDERMCRRADEIRNLRAEVEQMDRRIDRRREEIREIWGGR